VCACTPLDSKSDLDYIDCELLPKLQQLEVTICYKLDGQLTHCWKPTGEVLMWIMLYADDILLVCDEMDSLRIAVADMDATFLQ